MVNKQYTSTDLEAFLKIAANWQTPNQPMLEAADIKSEMQQYMNNPAMNMYKKRERTQNWNHQEKKFLLDLCRKDMRIIENKRLDAGLTAVKNKAWKIIHQKFSNQFGTDRTCNRLKEQWRRMKACTRNEILDYNNRMTRFGAEVADRKKPSPFTFEVWDFMQEAKKACKSEALDGIDYSKMPLALEEDFVYREDEHNPDEEHDMDDSRTPPQELCDVDIKEETNETFNDTHNDSLAHTLGDRLSVSPNQSRSAIGQHDADRASLHSPTISPMGDPNGDGVGFPIQQNGDFQPAFNMSNISATLEALNALRAGQFPTAAAAAAAAAAMQSSFAAHQHQAAQQQQQLSQSDELQTPPAKRQRTSSAGGGSIGCGVGGGGVGASDEPLMLVHDGGATSAAAAAAMSGANKTELRIYMEMQSKEHVMRMKILEVQLQTAKHNRDVVELNKALVLQKLQEIASKRVNGS